ncbi:hypothetical protein AL536_22515 [Vibrio fluvialis]|uniref:Uncharacterized protein n=1 Tax=Vibrio fluvialis TaxID=676 RepID=A0AAX2LSF7_VIBFL|nr:hypothetical protein AL536_22515 [Vibrio fluvialis]SUQ26240.1 Uncharacterised protein [Vibrio fluvialis]
MVNLTPEQITLLKWMRTGRTFQVCSDYCPHNGDVQPKSRLPIQVLTCPRELIQNFISNAC